MTEHNSHTGTLAHETTHQLTPPPLTAAKLDEITERQTALDIGNCPIFDEHHRMLLKSRKELREHQVQLQDVEDALVVADVDVAGESLADGVRRLRDQYTAYRLRAIEESGRLVQQNAKLVAALEPVLGLTTAVAMLLPAIRAQDAEQVNMLISLIAGADKVIDVALASVKGEQG